jgi:hypothetical protein
MPKFLIELKKWGNEAHYILLFVLRDYCGDGVEVSEDLANLLVNRPVTLNSSPLARNFAKLSLTHVLNSSQS